MKKYIKSLEILRQTLEVKASLKTKFKSDNFIIIKC